MCNLRVVNVVFHFVGCMMKKTWVVRSGVIRGLEKSVGNIRVYRHGKNDAAWGKMGVEWQDGCITATNSPDQAWYFRALSRLGTRNHSVMIVL